MAARRAGHQAGGVPARGRRVEQRLDRVGRVRARALRRPSRSVRAPAWSGGSRCAPTPGLSEWSQWSWWETGLVAYRRLDRAVDRAGRGGSTAGGGRAAGVGAPHPILVSAATTSTPASTRPRTDSTSCSSTVSASATKSSRPASPSYRSRVQVQTYDVGALLGAGEHELRAVLSDGWYRGKVGFTREHDVYGSQLAMLAQVEVDGAVVAATDATWTSASSAIVAVDLIDGEACRPTHPRRRARVAPGRGRRRRFQRAVRVAGPSGASGRARPPAKCARAAPRSSRRRPRSERQRMGAHRRSRPGRHRAHADLRRSARRRAVTSPRTTSARWTSSPRLRSHSGRSTVSCPTARARRSNRDTRRTASSTCASRATRAR